MLAVMVQVVRLRLAQEHQALVTQAHLLLARVQQLTELAAPCQ
jgi:hypothetical protein